MKKFLTILFLLISTLVYSQEFRNVYNPHTNKLDRVLDWVHYDSTYASAGSLLDTVFFTGGSIADWSADSSYVEGDVVIYDARLYQAIDTSRNEAPSIDVIADTNWLNLSASAHYLIPNGYPIKGYNFWPATPGNGLDLIPGLGRLITLVVVGDSGVTTLPGTNRGDTESDSSFLGKDYFLFSDTANGTKKILIEDRQGREVVTIYPGELVYVWYADDRSLAADDPRWFARKISAKVTDCIDTLKASNIVPCSDLYIWGQVISSDGFNTGDTVGAHIVSTTFINADSAMFGQDSTYSFPSSRGDSGDVMMLDHGGILYWTTITAGGGVGDYLPFYDSTGAIYSVSVACNFEGHNRHFYNNSDTLMVGIASPGNFYYMPFTRGDSSNFIMQSTDSTTIWVSLDTILDTLGSPTHCVTAYLDTVHSCSDVYFKSPVNVPKMTMDTFVINGGTYTSVTDAGTDDITFGGKVTFDSVVIINDTLGSYNDCVPYAYISVVDGCSPVYFMKGLKTGYAITTDSFTLAGHTINYTQQGDTMATSEWVRDQNYVVSDIKMCRLYKTSAMTINNSTWTSLTWAGENYDDYEMHSVIVNTERITVQETGYYEISGSVTFDSSNVGTRGLRLNINGAIGRQVMATPNIGRVTINVHDMIYLVAGQYLTISVWQNSGVAKNILGGLSRNHFLVRKIY